MEGRMRAVETTEPSQNQERSRPGQWEPNRVMLRLNRSVIHRNWSGEICRPAMQYINKNNLHNNKRDVFSLNLVNDIQNCKYRCLWYRTYLYFLINTEGIKRK